MYKIPRLTFAQFRASQAEKHNPHRNKSAQNTPESSTPNSPLPGKDKKDRNINPKATAATLSAKRGNSGEMNEAPAAKRSRQNYDTDSRVSTVCSEPQSNACILLIFLQKRHSNRSEANKNAEKKSAPAQQLPLSSLSTGVDLDKVAGKHKRVACMLNCVLTAS